MYNYDNIFIIIIIIIFLFYRNKSIIVDLLQGQLKRTTVCPECNQQVYIVRIVISYLFFFFFFFFDKFVMKVINFEPVTTLQLPLPGTRTVGYVGGV
jgi:hypothetical protein